MEWLGWARPGKVRYAKDALARKCAVRPGNVMYGSVWYGRCGAVR